ncbi:MAG: GTPase HflX [Variibacter sp.]|nr:GTPase HflX [Variibacter sp.]
MEFRKSQDHKAHTPPAEGTATRAVVIGPYLKPARGRRAHETESAPERDFQARLEEAVGLAYAIDLTVPHAGVVALNAVTPATYIGKGKVEEIAGILRTSEAGLAIMDCALSPVQQRNLEKAWNAKVLDRTGLILEIFGRRARTREGALQVEHAHLTYQKGRLVRSWTHLERQRGGFGFLGGPGETQLETDRRLIETRLARIERDLATVTRTRALHRDARRRVPYPVVALVGYTNAGKSTLFNRLTGGQVLEADLLFATLDPTLRAVKLPGGGSVILSDTVGFISNLPTMLIAAFRATLEEVVEADIVLHVRDISHPDSEAQAHDVERVLSELGIKVGEGARIIEIWNKIDLLPAEEQARLANVAARRPPDRRAIPISALTGAGLPAIATAIQAQLSDERAIFEVAVPAENGEGLSWLYRNAEVLDRQEQPDGGTLMRVRVDRGKAGQIKHRFLERAQPAG